MQRVVARARRHVLDTDRRLAEVVRHVSTARAGVGVARQTIEQQLVGRDAGSEVGAEVSVVGKQEVFVLREVQTDGDLDAFMTSTASVVAPTHAATNVETRARVHAARRVEQPIPADDGVVADLAKGFRLQLRKSGLVRLRSGRLRGHRNTMG